MIMLLLLFVSKIECQNGVINYVYYVPSLIANLLFIPQPTQTGKKVEFSKSVCVKDMHNNSIVIVEGIIDHKDKLYKLCEFARKYPGPTACITKSNDWSRI
jgi:hypothetical protein